MIKRRLLTLAMCAALACLLAGCGTSANNAASKVGETVSRVEDDISGAGSRMESALDGDSSHGSNPGAVDSGTDGFIGDESGTDGSSGLLSGDSSEIPGTGTDGPSSGASSTLE